jgi:hypothetical protein
MEWTDVWTLTCGRTNNINGVGAAGKVEHQTNEHHHCDRYSPHFNQVA